MVQPPRLFRIKHSKATKRTTWAYAHHYILIIYESWDAKARVSGFGPNCYCCEGAAVAVGKATWSSELGMKRYCQQFVGRCGMAWKNSISFHISRVCLLKLLRFYSCGWSLCCADAPGTIPVVRWSGVRHHRPPVAFATGKLWTVLAHNLF